MTKKPGTAQVEGSLKAHIDALKELSSSLFFEYRIDIPKNKD